MIVVLSSSADLSTDLICWYLKFYKVNFIRINDNFTLLKLDIVIDNSGLGFEYLLNDKFDRLYKVQLKDKVFYRRGNLLIPSSTNEYLKATLIKESELIEEILTRNFQYKKSDTTNNKLLNLEIAAKCDLSIPKTIITNDINSVIKEFEDCEKLITKPISNKITNI